ncbi:hypothetical protein V8B97DRAFT_1868146, partial [Scleroderma yunnanense]
ELDALKVTHQIVPVLAYTMDGRLIRPNVYQMSLEKPIVELCFNLSHWAIAGKKGTPGEDVFTVDVVLIHILAPLCPSKVNHAHKHKVTMFTEPVIVTGKRNVQN